MSSQLSELTPTQTLRQQDNAVNRSDNGLPELWQRPETAKTGSIRQKSEPGASWSALLCDVPRQAAGAALWTSDGSTTCLAAP